MIHEDILKDISKADAEEAAAAALYLKTKTALETEQGELNTAIDALKLAKGDKEQDVVDNTADRLTNKGSLEVVMAKIKAEAILQGGSFEAADPNRELKPGDAAALLQAG